MSSPHTKLPAAIRSLLTPTSILYFRLRRLSISGVKRRCCLCRGFPTTDLESSRWFGPCAPQKKPDFDSAVRSLRWGALARRAKEIYGASDIYSALRRGVAETVNLLRWTAEASIASPTIDLAAADFELSCGVREGIGGRTFGVRILSRRSQQPCKSSQLAGRAGRPDALSISESCV